MRKGKDPVPDPQHCMIGWQFLLYTRLNALCKKSIQTFWDQLFSLDSSSGWDPKLIFCVKQH